MHLIFITSVIRPQNAPTIFSPEERFQQLNDSIRSVRGKIPEYFVIVLEGSSYTDDQTKSVMESGAHKCRWVRQTVRRVVSVESILWLKHVFGSEK